MNFNPRFPPDWCDNPREWLHLHPPAPFPILDYSLAARDHDAFISLLRTHLLDHGCMYLSNTPVPDELIAKMTSAIVQYFAMPAEVKEACNINNVANFNGYHRRGPAENPSCEQSSYGQDNAAKCTEGAPVHYKLHGATPWPPEESFPGGRAVMQEYYDSCKKVSLQFTEYVAEALGLAPDGFESLFEGDIDRRQGRCRFLRYPEMAEPATGSALKAHTDANFLTYLLQATPESGLEIMMPGEKWVQVTAVPNTLLLLSGDIIEKITKGMVKATPHRVLSPDKGTRHSVAFFQGVAPDTRIVDVNLEFPQFIKDMARARQGNANQEYPILPNDRIPTARGVLNIKLKAAPLVAYKFYPDIFPELFPDGLPEKWARMLPEAPTVAV
ncbi:Fe2OG dioxygenase domain-containing protein [Mycena kentingensis (nom. inval.)]|nr:Fe2OG dioxygenase domain-containing protein [Mycena kentingensis (nom. inval.)]